MLSISSEDPSNPDINQEGQEEIEFSNYLNSIHRININGNLNIYLDEKMSNISLSPILPISKVDILLKLYNLNISKDDLIQRIIKILNGENSNKIQTYIQNSTKIQKANNQIKIIDDLFMNDCIILSKASKEGAHIIAERITKTIFRENINYKYETNKENGKKYVKAFLKLKENIYVQSDYSDNENEAKLNVNKKIINKFLPKKISKEIINNINECLKKEEISKNEKKARYEYFLQEVGGDRNLLKNKRKITQEEFSRRLPYFNMLDKDKEKKKQKNKNKNNDNNNNLMEEEDEEIYFMNTENIPIDEILLGDLGIVDNHLKDFKYTPLKIFEMIRDSEKKRGVDLKMEYTQVNDKNYCINSEATIFSQKLGIKVEGFGKSKEESENKCALNMLAIIFKNKFKTYFDLHNYFEHKNRRYLDIILNEENSIEQIKFNNKDKNKLNVNLNNNNVRKEIEEENCEDKNNKNYSILNTENIGMIESMPIFFNGSNLSFENIIDNNNSNANTDAHESSDNFNFEFNNYINNINSNNNNSNIRNDFGKLFHCNSYNNINYNDINMSNNSNNIINNKLIEELNENTNSSSSIESKKDIKKKKHIV